MTGIETVVAPIVISAIGGLVYGLLGYFKNAEPFDVKKAGTTAFVGLLAGAVAILIPSATTQTITVGDLNSLAVVQGYFTAGFTGAVLVIDVVKGLINRAAKAVSGN